MSSSNKVERALTSVVELIQNLSSNPRPRPTRPPRLSTPAPHHHPPNRSAPLQIRVAVAPAFGVHERLVVLASATLGGGNRLVGTRQPTREAAATTPAPAPDLASQAHHDHHRVPQMATAEAKNRRRGANIASGEPVRRYGSANGVPGTQVSAPTGASGCARQARPRRAAHCRSNRYAAGGGSSRPTHGPRRPTAGAVAVAAIEPRLRHTVCTAHALGPLPTALPETPSRRAPFPHDARAHRQSRLKLRGRVRASGSFPRLGGARSRSRRIRRSWTAHWESGSHTIHASPG